MLEFPSDRNDWRLDVVSILAVLGESNIKINSHLITASWTCLLPRLMPAPQGLLAEERSEQLPYEKDVQVIGVYSGNRRLGLNYFPNILHGSGERPFTIQEFSLEWDPDDKSEVHFSVQPSYLGALNAIAISSSLISLGLLIWSIIIKDGVALVGILIMSLATPVLCLGGKWSYTELASTTLAKDAPPGDVVIRARNGAFIIVHCSELLSRGLYFAPNDRKFFVDFWTGRATGGVVGGITLIVAIVLFGNCTWIMQAALAVTYTVLNVAYWSATLVKPTFNWDLDQKIGLKDRKKTEVYVELPANSPQSHHFPKSPVRCNIPLTEVDRYEHYTDTLWRAILKTGSAEWVEPSQALPATEAWKEWLREADKAAKEQNKNWDPRTQLSQNLREATENRLREASGSRGREVESRPALDAAAMA